MSAFDHEDDLERTAYHEAGHVVVALSQGARVLHATLEPEDDDDRQGDTRVLWPRLREPAARTAARHVKVALAGPSAEIVYTGEAYHPGTVLAWARDWNMAMREARAFHPSESLRTQLLEEAVRTLIQWMNHDRHWARIAALADVLLAHETIEEREVLEVVGFWSRYDGV